ncbi:MAG: histidine phosphatase family protein [Acidobacteriota bacterium]|nr:histidine phosphatase family protein [Acidobacteriota bacterium]
MIVVTGLPRSGTSMVMQMLAAGNVPVLSDGLREADEDNPRGYFEYEPVRGLLRNAGWLPGAEGKAIKIVAPLLPADLAARIILIERDLDEVLDSQERMLLRRNQTLPATPERRQLLKAEYRRIIERVKQRPGLLVLQYQDVVGDPLAAARRIGEFLGGGLDVSKMAEAVDPSLYRNRARATGRLILVRHGETEANRVRHFADSNTVPLTSTGREQARALAARLAADFTPDALVTSPFVRARQTAEIIGAAMQLSADVREDLRERDFGALKGRPYERMGELMLADPAYDPKQFWQWAPPEGESLVVVQRRAVAALETLGSGEIVVVCHGAVIQSVCAHVTGEWQESFVPPNCGFVAIARGEAGWEQPVMPDEWEDLAITS